MSTFSSPVDVAIGSLARSSDLNNLDAATAAAFALLPTNATLNAGTVNYAVDTGVANAYLVALPMTAASYSDGLSVIMKPLFANTGACTINVDSLGVKSIMTENNTTPAAGDILAGLPVEVRYSSTTGCFHLTRNSASSASSATARAAAAAVSAAAALVSQNAASGSASSASTSAGTATTQALAAASSASAALSSKNAAAISAAAALGSQSAAAISAAAALVSQNAASSSASTATTQAGNASTSAAAALVSQGAAAGSAAAALSSQGAAAISAAAALTAKNNAETAETNAETAETNAETAATNAGISAAAALVSQNAASGSASAALISQNAASGSAAAALISQNAAAGSASAALISQNAAEAAWDSLDDRYLGAKAADPALDNDGNALVMGAMYFNTVSSLMKVYSGSAWLVIGASEVAGDGIDLAYLAGQVTISVDLKANGGLVIETTELALDLGASSITGTLAVADGGTGRATSTTAYGLLAAGTTATGAHQTLAAGLTTQILVGGGASALPTWGTDIPTAVTIGTAYIYRAGGTDVPVGDGGTGASTLALNGILYGNAANAIGVTAIGAAGQILKVGASPFVPLWSTVVLTEAANTFNLTNGTASLDVAAGATLNIDVSLTVDGQATTITGVTQANTITLNEGFTIGDGYTGTLTFSAASKTLTVENTSAINQDVTSDASPTFNALNITSMGQNWTNAGRTVADAGILTTVDINGGTIDGATVGGATPAAGTFTTLQANTSIQLIENAPVLLDSALSADGKYSAIESEAGVLGETVAFGEAVYFKAADSRWWKTNATVATTSGPVRAGFCCVAGNAAGATTIMFKGTIRADSLFDTFTISAPVYLSAATAGKVVNTAPTGTADFVVRVMGHGIDGNSVNVNVSPDYITITA